MASRKFQRKKKKVSEKAALAARAKALAYLQENDVELNPGSTPASAKRLPTAGDSALAALRKRRQRDALAAKGVDVTVRAGKASNGSNAGASATASGGLSSKISSLLSSIQAATSSLAQKQESAAVDAVAAAQEGWEEVVDPHSGDTYWWHHDTNTVTWVPPGTHTDGSLTEPQRDYLVRRGLVVTGLATINLPKGWEMAVDADSGLSYYWNTATDETQWDAPSTPAMPQGTSHAPAADTAASALRARAGTAAQPAPATKLLKPVGKSGVSFGFKKVAKVKTAPLFKLAGKSKSKSKRKAAAGSTSLFRKPSSRPVKKLKVLHRTQP